MLEAMSIVAAVAMVVLLLRIRRHRSVAHQMWVKMVGMEFEIDRLPGIAPIEIVSERDHQRKAWEEHMEVEHFKDILDSLHVDTKTILQNLEQ